MAPSRRFIVTCSHHCHCHRANTTAEDEHNTITTDKDDSTVANEKAQSILPTPPSSPQLTSSSSASASPSSSPSTSTADIDIDALSHCLQ